MLVCFTRGWHLKNFQNASMLITSAGCNYFVGIPHINVLIYHWNMHPDKSYSSMWPSSTLRKEKEKGGMACTSFQSEIGFLHVKPLAYLDLLIGMVNWSFALKLCFEALLLFNTGFLWFTTTLQFPSLHPWGPSIGQSSLCIRHNAVH